MLTQRLSPMAPSGTVADPPPTSTTDSFNSGDTAENDIRVPSLSLYLRQNLLLFSLKRLRKKHKVWIGHCFHSELVMIFFSFSWQPFFVLHKASSGSNLHGKSNGTVKSKRRIDSPTPKIAKRSEVESVEEEDGQFFSTLRLKVFETVWSKIDKTIEVCLNLFSLNFFQYVWIFDLIYPKFKVAKWDFFQLQDVLRDSNSKVFSGIHDWIRESFKSIVSSGALNLSEAVRSYPILTQASSKQLLTAMVLTSKSLKISICWCVQSF